MINWEIQPPFAISSPNLWLLSSGRVKLWCAQRRIREENGKSFKQLWEMQYPTAREYGSSEASKNWPNTIPQVTTDFLPWPLKRRW